MGLGAFLDSGDYVTYSQLLMALHGIDVPGSAYRDVKTDFPVRYKRVLNNRFKVVYLDDFWEWAEEHKRSIDFSKMEENILGAEPAWAKRKRRIDFECRVNRNPWTRGEDAKLKRMIDQYKYGYTDIAAVLNRTEGAIKRRICTLKLKGRPVRAEVRPWEWSEVQTLVFMYQEGWSFEKIGAKLGRSGLSCRGKIELLEQPDKNTRAYRRREYQNEYEDTERQRRKHESGMCVLR